MNRIKPLVAIGLAAAAAAVWVVFVVAPRVAHRADSSTIEPSSPPLAGYVVEVDPATGQPAPTPEGAAPVIFDEEMRNRLSTSSQGLVEVPSPVPGGGTMVDLQGRFQHAFVATADDTGRVDVNCVSTPASASGEGGEGR
ncbi:MAG: hypothetical protein PVF33_01835 [Candidatus Latescibacterota bacterium]|jgi:hypothetical protein